MENLTVRTEDGRTLEVTVAGAEGGTPVFINHGTPASRALFAPWVEDAQKKGARLIAYNRPGYGGSSPRPGRSVADAARDVAQIADFLEIDRFLAWGLSGGGPHLLACAALLPDRVIAAASLAAVAPWDAEGLDIMSGMGEDNVQEFSAALAGPDQLEIFLTTMRQEMLRIEAEQMTELLGSVISAADRAVLSGDFGELFHSWTQEALRDGVEGWKEDDLAFVNPWGFELSSIEVPVLLRQGEQDLMVPFAHGRWLAERIPGVDARLDPAQGHLTLASAEGMSETLDWLLAHNR
jgi:pimeloyl-ACP methyl ester carboxylesterase